MAIEPKKKVTGKKVTGKVTKKNGIPLKKKGASSKSTVPSSKSTAKKVKKSVVTPKVTTSPVENTLKKKERDARGVKRAMKNILYKTEETPTYTLTTRYREEATRGNESFHINLVHFDCPEEVAYHTECKVDVAEQHRIMLHHLKQSIEKHMFYATVNDVKLHVTVDDAVKVKNQLDYIERKIEYPLKKHKIVTNYLKLICQRDILRTTRVQKQVMMDTDVLFTNDISDVFAKDFDIAFTRREWRSNRNKSINGGMIFTKQHAYKIYCEWVEAADRLLSDPELFHKYYQKGWGICQGSLYYMLDNGFADRYNVMYLPCSEWNCTNDGNKDFFIPEDARCIHFNFKSIRRYLTAGGKRDIFDKKSMDIIDREFFQYKSLITNDKRKKFREKLGYELDEVNPKTFNEKMHWKMINDRDPLITKTADKYAVREYVEEKGHGDILVPLLYYETEKAVRKHLQRYTIIKMNNASIRTIIVRPGLSVSLLLNRLNRWLNESYGILQGEWCYTQIKPAFVVEQMPGKAPVKDNINVYCFNGEPLYIRFNEITFLGDLRKMRRLGVYDLDWHYKPLIKSHLNKQGQYEKAPRPVQLERALSIAKDLSEPFSFVRVDFMLFQEKLFFSELTHYPGAGLVEFKSKDIDRQWGDLIDLNNERV